MLTLVTCMGGMNVDTGHAWEEWMLTLITCMGGLDVDTGHMHGKNGC